VQQDVFLFAGNVCSKDVLRWPRNDRPIDPEETSFSDEDFGWMYKLADPGDIITSGDPPLPRIAESGCGFDASMTFEAVADQAADWFCQEAGGGGCGCQCLGCLAEVQEQ